MRIRTGENHEWRTELYDDVAARLGENTRTGGIDAAAEFTRRMLANLDRAVEHPDMTEDLAEILSTPGVEVEYRVERGVHVRDQDRD